MIYRIVQDGLERKIWFSRYDISDISIEDGTLESLEKATGSAVVTYFRTKRSSLPRQVAKA